MNTNDYKRAADELRSLNFDFYLNRIGMTPIEFAFETVHLSMHVQALNELNQKLYKKGSTMQDEINNSYAIFAVTSSMKEILARLQMIKKPTDKEIELITVDQSERLIPAIQNK